MSKYLHINEMISHGKNMTPITFDKMIKTRMTMLVMVMVIMMKIVIKVMMMLMML